MRIDLMTPEGPFGYVDETGPDSPETARFLDGVTVPGGMKPTEPGYMGALLSLLRGGTYLWAQAA